MHMVRGRHAPGPIIEVLMLHSAAHPGRHCERARVQCARARTSVWLVLTGGSYPVLTYDLISFSRWRQGGSNVGHYSLANEKKQRR